MIAAINGISSYASSYKVYSAKEVLTEQTKTQLESCGINTSGITSEAQGQAVLQQVQGTQDSQGSQSSQETQETQDTQSAQQAPPSGGGNSEMESLMQDALSLAQKVGASVSSNDDLNDVLSAINDKISELQTEAANDPQKLARVTEFQAEYLSICELANSLQSAMQASATQKVQQESSTAIQTSMEGLANYNMASMSLSDSSKLKL